MSDAHAQALLRRIEAARQRRSAPARAWTAALGAAAVLALVLGGWLYSSRVQPLRLKDGVDLPASIVASLPRTLSLSDGSNLVLGAGSRLDVLETSKDTFVVAQRSGIVRFGVKPGGSRLWRIECGAVNVTVVGTELVVERAPSFVRVAVVHGAVVVRGERVPDRAVRLVAGRELTIPDGVEALPQEVPRVEPVADPALPASATTTLALPGAPSAKPPTAADADSLLAEADEARRSGDIARAVSLLGRVAADHSGSPKAALALFSLGRLHLDSLGKPARAADHFTRAVLTGLPAALAEDAEALIVEAHARANQRQQATEAAARYEAHYPRGRRAGDVRRWARSEP